MNSLLSRRFYFQHFLSVILVVLLLVGLSFCSTPTAEGGSFIESKKQTTQNDKLKIVIYGRHSCGLCRNFTSQLNADGFPFTFYDVDVEPEKGEEMWQKVKVKDPKTSRIQFPVVETNGAISISPDYTEWKSKIPK